ncbi:putative phosphodiesterase [Neomicrococcus aestuarii]|uniref:Putative phosphodiesterase n=1 Tax=Neomicrococcus aestuarii TaxID=556325 RepID=A0A7W8TXS7_9MICC|nr:hypothetical protein [Neomicrococcus aestuarii]MBB5513451.1 putative phosphodiesterase [Neomicrococcus aestuarii]
MGALEDLLNKPVAPGAPKGVQIPTFTKAWEKRKETVDGGYSLTSSILPADADDIDSILIEHDFDPKVWMLKPGTGAKSTHWDGLRRTKDESGDVIVESVPLKSVRIEVVPRGQSVDMDEIIAAITAQPPTKKRGTKKGGAFVFAIADWQVGKSENPLVDLATRINGIVDDVVHDFKRSGRPWVHIAFLGDELEGVVSQGGKNMWRTPITITEQTRIVRRTMLEIIDRFVDAGAQKVTVVAVPSNHGQAMREPVGTRSDDDWSVESLIAVDDSLRMNRKRYRHVQCFVPGNDHADVVVEVGGLVIGHAHGHLIQGFPSGDRVMAWIARNKLANNPVGHVRLLLTGHGHHFQVFERSGVIWCMAPSMEAESVWWKHRTGDIGSPGVVIAEIEDGQIIYLTKRAAIAA